MIIDVNRNESLLEFGKILKILVISEEIRFVVEKYNTKYFNRHLNAYATENLLGSKSAMHVAKKSDRFSSISPKAFI